MKMGVIFQKETTFELDVVYLGVVHLCGRYP